MITALGRPSRPFSWDALATLACLSAVILSVAACGPTRAQVLASQSILERHEQERQRCTVLVLESSAWLNRGMARLQQGDLGESQSLMGSAQTKMADAKACVEKRRIEIQAEIKAARIPVDVFAKVEKQWIAQHEAGSGPR
jgi:hypothetical protein